MAAAMDHSGDHETDPTKLAHSLYPQCREELAMTGFTMFQVLTTRETKHFAKAILADLERAPERRPGTVFDPKKLTLGNFGAFNIPSAFHAPSVRKLRALVFARAFNFFAGLLTPEQALEYVIDRLCYRLKNSKQSAGSWHRDFPLEENGNITFGGWLALMGLNPFTYVPSSNVPGSLGSGFDTIPKEDHPMIDKMAVTKQVPPGFLAVFDEQLVHKVNSDRLQKDSMRLFTAWRICQNGAPPLNYSSDAELLAKLDAQAPLTIKSGQEPNMYPKLYWTNHVDKLAKDSQYFNETMLTERTFASGSRAGKTYTVLKEISPPLTELVDDPAQLHPYELWEKNLHLPHRQFKVEIERRHSTQVLYLDADMAQF